MKFLSTMALAASLALGLSAPTRAQTASVAEDENQFAIALYDKLAAQPGNFVVSPYSVATALGMVYAGAKGQTAAEIAAALHVQNMSRAVFEHAMIQPPPDVASPIVFMDANALWVQRGFALTPGFRQTIQQTFGGDIFKVDFSNSHAAAERINDWADSATKGKIRDIAASGMFEPPPVLVLANAVYFKALWQDSFDKSLTHPQLFYSEPGQNVLVPTMQQSGDTRLLTQEPDADILTLPYQGDASMIIVLPKARFGLPAIEAGLSYAELNDWLANSREVLISLALPKFRLTTMSDLQTPLVSLGVKAVFSPGKADLSGIAAQKPYLGGALQKAFISVDESATEAAAASTMTNVIEVSGPPAGPPVPFIADHPFLYLIRANSTGAILFMGRVDNPAAN